MQPPADMHGGSSHMSLGQLGHAGSIALIISRSNLLFLDSAGKRYPAVQRFDRPTAAARHCNTSLAPGIGIGNANIKRRFSHDADVFACDMYRGELKNYNENFEHKSSAFRRSCSNICCSSLPKGVSYAQFFHYNFLILHGTGTLHMDWQLQGLQLG